MLASVDESVGRVLATLDEHGTADNTLVIFTSDNRVSGYVREDLKAKDTTDNAPLGVARCSTRRHPRPYLFRWPREDCPRKHMQRADQQRRPLPDAAPGRGGRLENTRWMRRLPTTGRREGRLSGTRSTGTSAYLGAGPGKWRTTPAGAIRSGDWKLQEYFEDGHVGSTTCARISARRMTWRSGCRKTAEGLQAASPPGAGTWAKMPTVNPNPTRPPRRARRPRLPAWEARRRNAAAEREPAAGSPPRDSGRIGT